MFLILKYQYKHRFFSLVSFKKYVYILKTTNNMSFCCLSNKVVSISNCLFRNGKLTKKKCLKSKRENKHYKSPATLNQVLFYITTNETKKYTYIGFLINHICNMFMTSNIRKIFV